MDCPFCKKPTESILKIERYPVFANAVEADVQEDRQYDFSVFYCIHCAFGFQENPPNPKELYTRVRAPSGGSKIWRRHYQALVDFAFPQGVKISKSALDVGAGHGFLSQLLLEKGLDVEALELNPGETLCNLGIPIHRHFLGDGFSLSKQFDFVISSHVMEHAASLNDFMKEIDALVAPGGTLVVSVPDSIAGMLVQDFSIFIPEHNWYFSERSLANVFSQIQFEIEEIGYFEDHSIFVRAKKQGREDYVERPALSDLPTVCARYRKKFSQAQVHLLELVQTSRRVFFFGAHSMTLNLIVGLKPWNLSKCHFGLLDNDPFKQGLRLSGTPWVIQSPLKANLTKGDLVVIPSSPYSKEMHAQILELAPGCHVEIIQ